MQEDGRAKHKHVVKYQNARIGAAFTISRLDLQAVNRAALANILAPVIFVLNKTLELSLKIYLLPGVIGNVLCVVNRQFAFLINQADVSATKQQGSD